MILTILVFLIILSILVLVHEFGHFLVAKKLGIKVEEFGIGFPPRALSFKRGETIYSINWLPIGGFVKLYGEDEAGGGQFKVQSSKFKVADRQRAFFARPPWQKALVAVAGVVMNAILAIAIFYVFLFISGFKTELSLISDHKFFGVSQKNVKEVVVNEIAKNSPAEKAGMTPFIKIVSVEGTEIDDSKDFVKIVNAKKGEKIEVVWENLRTNKISKATLVPRVSPPKNEGALGVSLFSMSSAVLEYKTGLQKTFSGVVHPANLLVYNFDAIGTLVKVSFERKTIEPVSQGVSGPLGIASITSTILQIQNIKERILQLLNLTGILSISLAFFNVLPIPALDGGRLFFILIEAFTGKKVNQSFETMAHKIGLTLLLGLVLLITLQDLQRLFSEFFSLTIP
jgi:regulator of sigma E protease